MFMQRPATMPRHSLPAQPRRSPPKGKIVTLDWYDLIGLGDVKPLIRSTGPKLARDRYELLSFMLDRFPATVRHTIATALELYPPTISPVPKPRNALAARLQGLLQAGYVIIKPRFPPDQNWPYTASPPHALNALPNAFVSASPRKLSHPGAQFLFILEAGWPGTPIRQLALRPYWPGGQSGVTLGAGYDMGERDAHRIARDLIAAGVHPTRARTIGEAFAMKRGPGPGQHSAQEALALNPEIAATPVLTDRTAWSLMLEIVESYEAETAWQIPANIRDRLFVYEFDALVAETYQWWSMPAGTIEPLRQGDLSRVGFRPSGGRAAAEATLFRDCRYDSAALHQA
jgi:hypothetical protein